MLPSLTWSLVSSAVAAVVVGYLFGSIPFGVLVTRIAGAGDVRSIGSGNIGATNVLRMGRKGLAAATLLGDTLKGTAAVLLARYLLGPEAALLAGLGAFVGHVFPVWLGFKGGKGVATYIGVLLGLAWPAAIAFCLIWLGVAAVTRYSSLAGLCATVAMPFVLWFYGEHAAAVLFVLLAAIVVYRHRPNIARLFDGTEPKIGRRPDGSPA